MQTGAAQTLASDNNPSAPSLQGTCEIHIPMADHLGNIRNYIHARSTAVDDGSGTGSTYAMVNFTPSANFEYDAFGREVRANGTTVAATNTPPGLTAGTAYADALPFHFSSKFTDPESGLNYYGYRYYDPKDGRWPSRDPIGEMGGINLYGMCHNNPLNFSDYLGREPQGQAPPSAPPPARPPAPPSASGPTAVEGKDAPLGNRVGPGPAGGNCASHATCKDDPKFDPAFPRKNGKINPANPPSGFEGCRIVKKEVKCDSTKKEIRVIIYIDTAKGFEGNENSATPKDYHVIGEDPANSNTYHHQTGEGGDIFNGITNPDQAAANYFDSKPNKAVGYVPKVAGFHYCCPCDKKK
jgi:RHS repeat-associated protein